MQGDFGEVYTSLGSFEAMFDYWLGAFIGSLQGDLSDFSFIHNFGMA